MGSRYGAEEKKPDEIRAPDEIKVERSNPDQERTWRDFWSIQQARAAAKRRAEIIPREKVHPANWFLSLQPPQKRRKLNPQSPTTGPNAQAAPMAFKNAVAGFDWLCAVDGCLRELRLADAIGHIICYSTEFQASICYRTDVALTLCHVRSHPTFLEFAFSSGNIAVSSAQVWPLKHDGTLIVTLEMNLRTRRKQAWGGATFIVEEDGWSTLVVKKMSDDRFAMHECDDQTVHVLFPMNQTEPDDSGAPHPFDPKTFMEMAVEPNAATDRKTAESLSSALDDDRLPSYTWSAVGDPHLKVPTSSIQLVPQTNPNGSLYRVKNCTIKLLIPKDNYDRDLHNLFRVKMMR